MSRVFLSRADVGEVEEEFVLRALRSGWVAPLGPDVDAFEAEVAERAGVASALALSSGTAALHLALLGLGAEPGTYVLCSTMTFAATANAIAYTGASPVFVDSDASDGNVDGALLLEAADTLRAEGKQLSAALVVDLFGRCADYNVIESGLAARGVPLLEDAAESFGARQGGTSAGHFGQLAALSFNGNKVMTTSGGGMLLSDDIASLDRARYLSTQARQPTSWYEHTEVGYNYRLSNVLAALGRGQLARLDQMIARRRAIRRRYVDALEAAPGVRFLGHTSASLEDDNCWLTSIVIDPNLAAMSADDVMGKLAADDIESRHVWKPMHLQPAFENERSFVTGRSEMLFATGLTLPSGSALSDDEIERVLAILVPALAR
jgi:dTDP-4-amino-4,6-dideoxygalactose transaminase